MHKWYSEWGLKQAGLSVRKLLNNKAEKIQQNIDWDYYKIYQNKWQETLVKDLQLPIWSICAGYILLFRMVTHCVASWVRHIITVSANKI